MQAAEPEILLDDSDYGDFGNDNEELEVLQQLVTQTDGDIEEAPQLRLPKTPGLQTHSREKIYYDTERQQRRTSDYVESPAPEDQSPLERFRKPPRKGFSVTDLVSPAWCELQFYYSLKAPGRKKRTAAMKKGSAVHQALEDEVHSTVPVTIAKKEDKWGLKIWNIIQGLRTLRETGRTRELEVWGIVGGEIVNGIIDELSYECPNPTHVPLSDAIEIPHDQTDITTYLSHGSQVTNQQHSDQNIYITDVKTRGTPTLPTGSRLRPTILQLHLYHHLLENMILGRVNIHQLAERYSFDVTEAFSDSFIAQIGSLSEELSEIASSQGQENDKQAASQDAVNVILAHNNPASLWRYLMDELRVTFIRSTDIESVGADQDAVQQTRLSNLLTAEYVAPTYKHIPGTSKKSIGKKTFGFNAAYLNSYLADSLTWWHGKREAQGVKLEDAWKCRYCDFKNECTWIHERDAANLQEVIEKMKLREAAGIKAKTTEPTKG